MKANLDIYVAYNLYYELGRFFLVFLQIPFKFYLIKEFMFVLYDEFKNRGISSKINDLKTHSSSNAPYSALMVKKIRKDLYQIVRQPFLKLSSKEYYIISTIVYAFTIPPIIIMHFFVNTSTYLLLVHWEILNLSCAIVEPIIIFIVAGYYYQCMCVEYEIK